MTLNLYQMINQTATGGGDAAIDSAVSLLSGVLV